MPTYTVGSSFLGPFGALGPLSNYWVDLWSLVHVVTFALLARVASRARPTLSVGRNVLAMVVIGLAWEVLEGRIEWLWTEHGEPPWNRWLSDPAMDALGAWLGARRR